jgi:hypothetical protein
MKKTSLILTAVLFALQASAIKWSEMTEDADPALTDIVVGLSGGTNTQFQIQNLTKVIQLSTTNAEPAWSAGMLSYNTNHFSAQITTGFEDVTVTIGREDHILVYNDSGSVITNGYPVSATGLSVGEVPSVLLTDTLSVLSTLAFAGVTTMDIPAGEVGIATTRGLVHDVDTSGYVDGFLYADGGGPYLQSRPLYPRNRLIIGGIVEGGVTNGVISVGPLWIKRSDLSRSYGFTSSGVSAGMHWKAGFYDWGATDANLTQASTSVTYGDAVRAYAAHVGVVPSGAGVVDTGVVGLRVIGIEDSELGIQVAGQTNIITADITTLSANTMVETSAKYSGQVTIELYVVSGAPVNYSLDFNYGYSKYDDLGNNDFTITGFECVWQGNASSTLDIALMKHTTDGWTYASTGFVAGNGDICRKTVDQALAGDVVNNEDGAYKRVELNEFIDGNGSEGFMIQVITGANGTLQTMDLHVTAVSEELE